MSTVLCKTDASLNISRMYHHVRRDQDLFSKTSHFLYFGWHCYNGYITGRRT